MTYRDKAGGHIRTDGMEVSAVKETKGGSGQGNSAMNRKGEE